MTRNEFLRRFPQASPDAVRANTEVGAAGLRDAEPKLDEAKALDGAIPRQAAGVGLPRVVITGFCTKPKDRESYWASCKDLIDGLWRSSLVQGDAEDQIDLLCQQAPVRTKKEEMTVIEITYGQ